MSKMKVEDQFEKIAEDAILKAEKVDCSFDEFVGGLSGIMITIKERWELAVDEQRQKNAETEED
jgi:hypothetical protein